MSGSKKSEGEQLVALDAELPDVAGTPCITQGVYGERGNLELVAPDAKDGLWVFWYNGDAKDFQLGARRGCWSGGLRFAQGFRYNGAAIVQSRHGPHWLEVVATSDDRAQRFTWRPESGFTRTDDSWRAIGSPAATETNEGVLLIATVASRDLIEVRSSDGVVKTVATDRVARGVVLSETGELIWGDEIGVHTETGTVVGARWPAAVSGGHIAWIEDRSVKLSEGPALECSVLPDDLSLAASHIDADRLELILRCGASLWHARFDVANEIWGSLDLVTSRIWARSRTSEVHRL